MPFFKKGAPIRRSFVVFVLLRGTKAYDQKERNDRKEGTDTVKVGGARGASASRERAYRRAEKMWKKRALAALAVGLATLLIPAAVCGVRLKQAKGADGAAPPRSAETAAGDEVIAVFLPETDETKQLSMRDYVIGCVAAEMPAAYEEAALCAQAAASATLARYMQANNRGNAALKGAVIAADPGSYQGYFTEEEMRERWGEDYDRCYAKIAAAVDETLPYEIDYDGAPIVAAFHAISSGETESAETVWGKEIPYLVTVESEGDRLCPGYASSVTVSAEEFREKLGLSPGDAAPEDWIGDAEYSDAGTLLTMTVCGKTVSGSELRTLFSLRSAAVRADCDGDEFTLDVTGYGHGVGMSQYGADYYARQGWTWQEIVQHYYPGAVLNKIKND